MLGLLGLRFRARVRIRVRVRVRVRTPLKNSQGATGMTFNRSSHTYRQGLRFEGLVKG